MDWMNEPKPTFKKNETAIFCIQLEIIPSWESPELIRIIEQQNGELFLEYSDIKVKQNEDIKIKLLKILKNIDLSTQPKPSFGVDGTFFELSIYSLWNKITFNWWSDVVGENWKAIVDLKNELIELKNKNE